MTTLKRACTFTDGYHLAMTIADDLNLDMAGGRGETPGHNSPSGQTAARPATGGRAGSGPDVLTRAGWSGPPVVGFKADVTLSVLLESQLDAPTPVANRLRSAATGVELVVSPAETVAPTPPS